MRPGAPIWRRGARAVPLMAAAAALLVAASDIRMLFVGHAGKRTPLRTRVARAGFELPKPPPRKIFADDFTDEDIERFYQETISGSGGEIPPGRLRDLLAPTQKDYDFIIDQMRQQTWRMYGGPRMETLDDGKGWVWIVAEFVITGFALQIYTCIPYGRRPLLIAKRDDVDGMLEKVNWAKVEERIDITLGTQIGEEARDDDEDMKDFGTEKTADSAAEKSPAAETSAASSEAAPPPVPAVDGNTLTVPKLRKHLAELGLDSSGTKDQLLKKLEAAQASR